MLLPLRPTSLWKNPQEAILFRAKTRRIVGGLVVASHCESLTSHTPRFSAPGRRFRPISSSTLYNDSRILGTSRKGFSYSLNMWIERTIGAGILVEARRGLPPLAAHPPCWADVRCGS